MKIVNIEPTITKLKELQLNNVYDSYLLDSIIIELENLPTISANGKYATNK